MRRKRIANMIVVARNAVVVIVVATTILEDTTIEDILLTGVDRHNTCAVAPIMVVVHLQVEVRRLRAIIEVHHHPITVVEVVRDRRVLEAVGATLVLDLGLLVDDAVDPTVRTAIPPILGVTNPLSRLVPQAKNLILKMILWQIMP
jgi:hypothetical protein